MWEFLKGRGVTNGRLTNMHLIVAINVVAGLGIFFSGYDQGVMAGVNVAPDYLVSIRDEAIYLTSFHQLSIRRNSKEAKKHRTLMKDV